MNDFRVITAGDACLMVVFEERMDANINLRCIALARDLHGRHLPGVRDVVPTFHTVAVYFDPRETNGEALGDELARVAPQAVNPTASVSPVIEIPVCYGGELGPDLTDMADAAGCTEQEIVERHTAAVYRVFMLGFLPGFAYMGPVDARIATPRLPRPRPRVPAGSVGIAGFQTGIYPFEAPGGWRLIGRTTARPFVPARASPFLFKAGDRVRFTAVHAPASRHASRA